MEVALVKVVVLVEAQEIVPKLQLQLFVLEI
jgi:hypothetical protein